MEPQPNRFNNESIIEIGFKWETGTIFMVMLPEQEEEEELEEEEEEEEEERRGM